MDVLALFEKLVAIPHCSGKTTKLREFISQFAKACNFSVEIDSAGNILCYKQRRDIALQAHYDMVCVGNAPHIELVQKDGYLMAKDSSLGADNGIGVAMMLALMQDGCEAEYLFTNDEEIGLIGANNLELELQAKRMINLDSEEFGAIFVGCAGGVDIYGNCKLERGKEQGTFWRVHTHASGGHSGVDIDKEIPNAIKELAHYLATQNVKIATFSGGERINSIPAYAEAVVCGKLEPKEGITIEPAEAEPVLIGSEKFLQLLLAIPHGVRGWHKELGIPLHSQNLAIVKLADCLQIAVSARSMTKSGLERLQKENEALLGCFGCSTKSQGRYDPWEPEVGEFAKEFAKFYENVASNVSFKAIHAGLEAAVLAKKFPGISIISIGPDILYPHSTKECLKLGSVELLYKILKEYLCAIS